MEQGENCTGQREPEWTGRGAVRTGSPEQSESREEVPARSPLARLHLLLVPLSLVQPRSMLVGKRAGKMLSEGSAFQGTE